MPAGLCGRNLSDMDIYLDNKPLNTDQNTNAPLNIALSSITDIATGKIPFSKTIKIPDTPENRRKLGYSSEVFALERFNNGRHPARIEQDGFVVMQGIAQLSKVETTLTGRYFHLNLIGEEIEWIKAASETPLSGTELGLSGKISDTLVRESLADTFPAPFRLSPIQKGRFIEEAGEDNWRERKWTLLSDYVPFFRLVTLFRLIFTQAGYAVESSFLDGGAMGDLYISGRWRKYDVDELDEKYGFRAGRFSGQEIGIGLNGIDAMAVGNIVDTADPEEENSDGEKVDDVYNHGGGFQMIEGKPVYVVAKDMTVGLLYTLHYFSPITVDGGAWGFKNNKWFDRVEIAETDGSMLSFDITKYAPNFDIDARKAITGETKYYFVLSSIFLSAPSKYEKLLLGFKTDEENAEDIPEVEMMEIHHKDFFTTPDTAYGRAYLFGKNDKDKPELLNDAVWKIMEVPTEVEITAKIYIPARRYTAGTQIRIASPAFRGYTTYRRLETLALSGDTTVETYFSPQAGVGDEISSENMLALGEIKQLDIIKAVKQLFNLHLYTDTATRTVYVEPRDDFYNGPVLDWTDKIDYSKTIEMEELGGDLGNNFILTYKDGDPQVSARNESSKTKYAEFTTPILNTVSKKEDYTVANEFFTPAIIRSGGYSAAKDAALLQIGDPSDTDNESPYERDMTFEPKVVRYGGLRTLPTGQQWLYPSGADNVVPAISFQDEATNLGFDKEDGLNRYYQENIELYNHGRRLTLHLHLTPRDVEPFIILNDEKRDFRATVKLRMAGEDVLCKLEEIKDFDPAGKGSTKCVLITG